jgi:hypothetical protein
MVEYRCNEPVYRKCEIVFISHLKVGYPIGKTLNGGGQNGTR